MTQPLPAHVIERLGYIRFLHQEGIDQARRRPPMSSTAILFHDAIELFYVLALDHMGVQVHPKTQFDAYWTELSKVVSNLSGRRGMERLNRVRVGLKHHGSIPGTQQISDARTDVDAFLAANTPAVFGIDYDTLTMIDVVPQQAVQNKLQTALAAELSGDHREAMGLLAEAFDELLNPQHHHYVESLPLSFGDSLEHRQLRSGEAASILTGLRGDQRFPQHNHTSDLGDQIEETTKVATAAQAALRVMVMGIDYPRYLRFSQLTPRIIGTHSNPLERFYPAEYAPSHDDFEYCQQFVIEFALRVADANATLEFPSRQQ